MRALVPLLFLLACKGGDAAKDAPAAAGDGALATEDDKTLYAVGLSLGRSLEQLHLTEADLSKVQLGLRDSVTGQNPQVELDEYIGKVRELAKARVEAGAKIEKEKGDKFLADLAGTAGAQKAESGLVYIETQAGAGASPAATDTVTVNYKGTLTDGTEFDSSYSRNQPATFALNRVVPCWTEALQKMKVGGKAKVGCPSTIAYGDAGSPPKIPGGAALVFEIELLSIGAPK